MRKFMRESMRTFCTRWKPILGKDWVVSFDCLGVVRLVDEGESEIIVTW
jgi:hypothetical protein